MFSFEVEPAFRGATYSDELQMVHADTGAPLAFLPAIDDLVWRLFPVEPRSGFASGYGWGCGWDYGLGANGGPLLNPFSLMTLTLGAGLTITVGGTALWIVPMFPAWLHRSEYRMTLDLIRYGEVCRVMDTILPVER